MDQVFHWCLFHHLGCSVLRMRGQTLIPIWNLKFNATYRIPPQIEGQLVHYTVLLHWSTSNITNFFSPRTTLIPSHHSSRLSRHYGEGNFLGFWRKKKMWRSQEGRSTADRVAARRWRRRDKERACGELCWHIALSFKLGFLPFFASSVSHSPRSSLPTHTPVHC